MIEIIAEGPVPIVTDDRRINRQDGHDRITGRSEVRDELTVFIDLELPQGHVNLEGFVLSPYSTNPWEIVGRYVDIDDSCVDRDRIDRRDWSVDLRGEWWDWIQQAHRYQTERPTESIVSCLELFRSWDETDTSTLDLAIKRVENSTDVRELAAIQMGELTDTEYGKLRRRLNVLQDEHTSDRHGIAPCKKSYS